MGKPIRQCWVLAGSSFLWGFMEPLQGRPPSGFQGQAFSLSRSLGSLDNKSLLLLTRPPRSVPLLDGHGRACSQVDPPLTLQPGFWKGWGRHPPWSPGLPLCWAQGQGSPGRGREGSSLARVGGGGWPQVQGGPGWIHVSTGWLWALILPG